MPHPLREKIIIRLQVNKTTDDDIEFRKDSVEVFKRCNAKLLIN